ncbi:dihydropteroate synthase [Campylobacter mucosalis]|uniref:dihydropteroate synthase n=1 Tax=Campylobacter mucosalis TaxID=202 RepID=UPI0004D83B67|nr:dihydropteroate synthase [Campylobacter mucosalis]KEA46410.1 dihydropteroate synthase [Campylobacter mucosalis]QKF63103.1 dihydropteroate synthase [Campylobacter mucosalis]
MKFYKINEKSNFDEICKSIAASTAGVNIMREKSTLNFIYIKDIKSPAANILKQDALSVGADLVTHKDTIFGRQMLSDALLIGSNAQLKKLAKKEKLQDFGLKNLADFLALSFKKPQKPEIMGVLNINDDSFNEASRVDTKSGIEKAIKMIEQGATYIDLGGVSSRPGSEYCGRDEEFRRIKDIVAEICRQNLHEKVKFSLDSFDEYCLEYALNHGFKMINDITANPNLAHLAKKYDAQFCLMHMQNDPKTMQNAPHYDDLIAQIDEFFKEKIEKSLADGAKNLVLDVGIGFGKTPQHNMLLIKHLEHFTHFGYPLLIGASRKSVINFYHKSEVKDRLSGSLYLHLKAYENGASIIRTHDVFEHSQLFNLHLAYESENLW